MARSINALLIDDSGTTRKMIMQLLDQTGLAAFTFTEADDGVEALEKFNPAETEIIFVDMNMPRMGGLEFVRELRKRHRKCPPTVMITGESSQEKLKEAISELRVDAFMLKPVDRDRLRSGLQKLIDSMPERAGSCVVPHGECVPVAVRGILSQACGLDVTPIKEDPDLAGGQIIQGMIVIYGAVQWAVVLGFARQTAIAAASKFAGDDQLTDEEDVADAIGEFTNMVGARTKTLLVAKGLKVNMSLPTVLGATDLRMLIHRKATSSHTYFDSSMGKLWTTVAVGMHPGMLL